MTHNAPLRPLKPVHTFISSRPLHIVNSSNKKAIDSFDEREQMKRSILALGKRVTELERRLGVGSPNKVQDDSHKQMPAEDKKQEMLNQISAKLRTGEINLPAYPDVNTTFKKMLGQGANVNEITDLLKKDIAISSKLIGLSNSPHYRGVTKNRNLEQAVSRLGLKVTSNWVELITNRSLYTTEHKKYLSYLEDLWQHSLACAYSAQFIATLLQLRALDEVFAMALFHDIGKLMLIQIIAELEIEGSYMQDLDDEEVHETAQAYHTQFGASVLTRWKLPDEYAHVARWHHDLDKAAPVSKELLVVHLANWVVKAMGYGHGEPEEVDLAGLQSAKILKMSDELIDQVKSEVSKMMENGSQSFA